MKAVKSLLFKSHFSHGGKCESGVRHASQDSYLLKCDAVRAGLSGKMLISLVRVYQLCISPFLMPGKCRFTPTCSVYFIQAVEKYGPFKGSWLGIKRILKCHPFHEGGYDPLK